MESLSPPPHPPPLLLGCLSRWIGLRAWVLSSVSINRTGQRPSHGIQFASFFSPHAGPDCPRFFSQTLTRCLTPPPPRCREPARRSRKNLVFVTFPAISLTQKTHFPLSTRSSHSHVPIIIDEVQPDRTVFPPPRPTLPLPFHPDDSNSTPSYLDRDNFDFPVTRSHNSKSWIPTESGTTPSQSAPLSQPLPQHLSSFPTLLLFSPPSSPFPSLPTRRRNSFPSPVPHLPPHADYHPPSKILLQLSNPWLKTAGSPAGLVQTLFSSSSSGLMLSRAVPGNSPPSFPDFAPSPEKDQGCSGATSTRCSERSQISDKNDGMNSRHSLPPLFKTLSSPLLFFQTQLSLTVLNRRL